ncbi:hypothetical protein DdX_12597 [Ditylenchus destructor]|uniref:Uncharacterized protein n=1 Tax=Ditylenchus destructor TaxID=166010 RepID=A0AAD4MYQ0_9BILA|nr:hypothetical protein DdX_12597 [Ditylenchus destructor]
MKYALPQQYMLDHFYDFLSQVDSKFLSALGNILFSVSTLEVPYCSVGTNFIFMDPSLHKLKIRELVDQNRTDICVSTGGCDMVGDTPGSCDNMERVVLVAFVRAMRDVIAK